jgi:hypothetical protein
VAAAVNGKIKSRVSSAMPHKYHALAKEEAPRIELDESMQNLKNASNKRNSLALNRTTNEKTIEVPISNENERRKTKILPASAKPPLAVKQYLN